MAGFLQDGPNVTKRRSVSTTLRLSTKLEASLEVCNVSHTQQARNWHDQNMVEVTWCFYSAVLYHWAVTSGRPSALTTLHMYYTSASVTHPAAKKKTVFLTSFPGCIGRQCILYRCRHWFVCSTCVGNTHSVYFPIASVVVCERSKDETKQLLGCEDGSLVRLLLCKKIYTANRLLHSK